MKILVSSDPTLSTPELYNPLTSLKTNELMEKFNLAFYEAQNVSRTDLIRTFKQETANENNSNHSEEKFNDEDLIDYLISEDSTLSPTECDITFDFNDFEQDFDNNVNKSGGNPTNLKSEVNFDVEAYSNNKNVQENCVQYPSIYIHCVPNSPFEDLYPKSPLADNNLYQNCDQKPILNVPNVENQEQYIKQALNGEYQKVDLDDLDLEVLSNVDSWNNDLSDRTQDFGTTTLPPVNTITKNNVDFNNYVRTIPINDCGYFKQDYNNKSEFGHLLSTTPCQNNPLENILTNDTPPPTPACDSTVDQIFFASTIERRKVTQVNQFGEDNHMVLTQNEALLNDDPLLSSSSILFTSQEGDIVGEIYDNDYDGTDSEETVSSSTNYMCKWEQCYQLYDSQRSLVKHIEKCHVELKRGDEFTCFWENCPRKIKPFNARYKLLIHMRVHSGEKPNKCMFKGCNKAFSRLENLKIHQRSHTGERPYICQFTGCTKCFSNSSDRAKHQRTHFDTKPYACQVRGCPKKYTDPSSLRKHVKNHTYEEQQQIKRGKLTSDSSPDNLLSNPMVRQFLDPSKQKALRGNGQDFFYNELDHSYSNNSCYFEINGDSRKSGEFSSVKRDLKNKIQKNRLKKLIF